jgi:hypothetical protein
MKPLSPLFRATLTRENNRRAAGALFPERESRNDVARREREEESAAREANTARLRKLRLEREMQDTAVAVPAPAIIAAVPVLAPLKAKKTIRRINCT